MDRFEEQLKNALRRESPSSGFASRVQARVARETKASPRRWLWFPRKRWAVAFALCVAVIGGLEYRRVEEEKLRGEAARQQVMVALRLASSKIQFVQSKVQHLSD